MQALLLALSVF